MTSAVRTKRDASHRKGCGRCVVPLKKHYSYRNTGCSKRHTRLSCPAYAVHIYTGTTTPPANAEQASNASQQRQCNCKCLLHNQPSMPALRHCTLTSALQHCTLMSALHCKACSTSACFCQACVLLVIQAYAALAVPTIKTQRAYNLIQPLDPGCVLVYVMIVLP